MDVVAADLESSALRMRWSVKLRCRWGVWRRGGGEASFDETDGSLEGFLRGEEQVEVVGHDDEGVEFVVTFGSVVLEGFEEEFGVGGDLEEAATVVGSAGDEEGSGAGCAGWDRIRRL